MTAKPPARRCAVYTRKSSEEGLEQDFNSLHAQREACEAFIRSQRSEGWRLTERDVWPEPDMGVLRLHRRAPPTLPIEVFGPTWGPWIVTAAEAAACPADYVAAPLLASVSALIGHARWAQATPGWAEPPHLWTSVVGDSGDGKSPGADCLLRDVLPEIERRMIADYPDRLREWRASFEFGKAAAERWRNEVRDAEKKGAAAPLPPMATAGPEPNRRGCGKMM